MQFAGEASIAELTGEVHAHNTFEQPDCIMHQDKIEQWSGKTKTIEVGPCSVYKVSVQSIRFPVSVVCFVIWIKKLH